ESRRRRRQLGSPLRRERYLLPAGDGDAPARAERRRDRELSLGSASRARDRRSIRVRVNADRRPAARDGTRVAPECRGPEAHRQLFGQRPLVRVPPGGAAARRRVPSHAAIERISGAITSIAVGLRRSPQSPETLRFFSKISQRVPPDALAVFIIEVPPRRLIAGITSGTPNSDQTWRY